VYQPFLNKYLQDISDKKLFLIAGENDYYRINAKKYILNHFSDYPIVKINNATIEAIQLELSMNDLFSEKKIVFIDNFLPITSTSTKKINDDDFKSLLSALENSDNIIIFCNDNVDLSYFIECINIVKKEFIKFLEYLNEKHHLKIKKDVLIELSNHLDEKELLKISKEFEKLSLYQGEINKANIFDLISLSNTFQVFDLVDKLVNKNISMILDIYENLLFNKQSEYMTYHFISGQFSSLLKIKMIDKDKLQIDVPKTIGIHPFAYSKLVDYSKKFTIKQLCNIQACLLDTDFKIKQGIVPSKEAVKFLLLSICGI
jgi:DNA polymerase III delta subunit